MNQIINFIEKFGKRNFILVLFIICVLVISGFYATFSLSATSNGVSVVDNILTLNFILGEENSENSIIIPANSRKHVEVYVSNREDISLKYGVYYSYTDSMTGVFVGYHHGTSHLPNGIIPSNSDYVVTLDLENQSSDIKTVFIGIVYGLVEGGDLVLSDNQHFFEEKFNFPLSEVSRGSYVKYNANGDEGFLSCDGNSQSNGFRVGYSRWESAYLISEEAVGCLDYNDNDEFNLDINEYASSYCNINYAYDGVCDERSVWGFNLDDYYHVTGYKFREDYCLNKGNNKLCGYLNDLININSSYFIVGVDKDNILYYDKSSFLNSTLNRSYGIRPVIRLASSVVVVSGSGSKDDPYLIKNTNYAPYEYKVVYYGNGATDGDTPDSVFVTNEASKLNKNGFVLEYEIKLSDSIGVFDDSYCDLDGVCHPSSVNDVEKKSAKFLGWSLHEGDGEVVYHDMDEVMNLSLSSDEVIVNLYAVWEYDPFRLPDIQKRDGYEIMGWYTDKDGGDKVGNPGDEYSNVEKVTLYARWSEKNS